MLLKQSSQELVEWMVDYFSMRKRSALEEKFKLFPFYFQNLDM